MLQRTDILNKEEKRICPDCGKKMIGKGEDRCFDCQRAISVKQTKKIAGETLIPY